MDFTDILVVVVAIGGAILSAIAKNAKKKNTAAHSEEPEYDSWTQEGEFEPGRYMESVPEQGVELYTLETIPQQDRELYTLETPSRPHWSYDQQAVAETGPSQQVNDMFRPMHHISDPVADINKERIADEPHGDLSGNINLRDVIIYSELLKPKFKEY